MIRTSIGLLFFLFCLGCQAEPPVGSSSSAFDANRESEEMTAKTQQLIEGAFRGEVEIVTSLLKDKINVDARYGGSASVFKDDQGTTPVDGANWTALHAAASALHPDIVKLLVDAGANLDLDDGHGATALYMSLDVYDRMQAHDDCALLLIQAGAKVNTKTRKYVDEVGGYTPLHRAVCWNQQRAVFALIKAGANVNGRNDGGATPLHEAYLCDVDAVIVEALHAAGADPNAKDNQGRKPLYWQK